MSIDSLMEHFMAGDACDSPENCTFCGKHIAVRGAHLMHDPDGTATSIEFCSADCLNKATSLFDHLTPTQLDGLELALSLHVPD